MKYCAECQRKAHYLLAGYCYRCRWGTIRDWRKRRGYSYDHRKIIKKDFQNR